MKKFKQRYGRKLVALSEKLGFDVYLQNTKGSFTIWVEEEIVDKENGNFKAKHWVIDASTFAKEGVIRFGNSYMYKINAKYDKNLNEITIVRKKARNEKTRKR